MRKKILIGEFYIGNFERYWMRITLKKLIGTFEIPFLNNLESLWYEKGERMPTPEERDAEIKSHIQAFVFRKVGKPIELKTRIVQKFLLVEVK